MFGDPKSKYLFAFEAAVNKLIVGDTGDREVVSRFYQHADRRFAPGFHLSEGMWTNAHMHYGGLPPEDGARRFYEDVLVKYHSPSLKAAREGKAA